MINDRGAKKWATSFMLPEHVAMLSKMVEEQKLVEKPILDEQEFEQIGMVIMDSLNHTLPVKVTYWQDGKFKIRTGIVDSVDMLIKEVKLELLNGDVTIAIDSITAAERV
jgi:hypothetical protein